MVLFRLQPRIVWLFVLVFHIIGAGTWFYLMPAGFPIQHARFFANRVIPVAVIITSLIGLYGVRTGNTDVNQAVRICFSTGWISAAISGIMLYPISGRIAFIVALGIGVGMSIGTLDYITRQKAYTTITTLVLGASIGTTFPFTQRAEVPSTHPINTAIDQEPTESLETAPGDVVLSQTLHVSPSNGAITFQKGRVLIKIEPLLTFTSRSPDRCWVAFAPAGFRDSRPRTLTKWSRSGSSLNTRYSDLGMSDLRVSAIGDNIAQIEASSQLHDTIYSHLNTFTEIFLTGHSRLSVAFSPCPTQRIDVRPFDYPVGKPARFAYLDSSDIFHIVEAASGEKGPYRELASGKHPKHQPLAFTLYDDGRPVATVALSDWSRQLATNLSPTAGWGVAQNSIEFSLHDDNPRSSANFFISLASTSPGRGFDSVGHAPGVYRNKMRVTLAQP